MMREGSILTDAAGVLLALPQVKKKRSKITNMVGFSKPSGHENGMHRNLRQFLKCEG